ncbi:NAD-binding protein [Moniliophthora roreri]|nr:NAD-binding protein [Moniliophthora roreri]
MWFQGIVARPEVPCLSGSIRFALYQSIGSIPLACKTGCLRRQESKDGWSFEGSESLKVEPSNPYRLHARHPNTTRTLN